MAFSVLRFPEDIKWERLCVTESMMDREVCDRLRPKRWRSSAAIFTYEPPEEEQVYPDHIVCYLKVVATITGYQPEGREIGVPDSEWETLPGIDDFEEVLNEYYPCYGALMEVVVGPSHLVEEGEEEGEGHTEAVAADIPLGEYPYVISIEPRKRELYELVSDTSERSSRSLEGVNIRAGTTTTDSTEILDIDQGFNVSIPVAEGAPPVGFGMQGQTGSKSLAGTERTDIKTTDSIEEMRNTFSRTTNLTQMYSLLQSYHLGTNRSTFFLQPRPHTVQNNFTFVNGPRELEGTQEVFLAVVRPKNQGPPCVLIDLETAHLAFRPEYTTQTRVDEHELHILAKAEDRGGSLGDDSASEDVSDSSTYLAPDGWEIEGWEYASVSYQSVKSYNVEFGPAWLTIYGTVTWTFNDRTVGNELIDGRLDVKVRIFLKKKAPTQTGEVETLFLTGRRLCCCDDVDYHDRLRLPDWIVGERPLAKYAMKFYAGSASKESLLESRRIVTVLGRVIRQLSTGRSRYPLGQVHFFETDLFQRRLAEHLRAQGAEREFELRADVPRGILKRYGPKRKQPFTIADFLSIPASELARAMERPVEEVRRERITRIIDQLRGEVEARGDDERA